MLDFPGFCAYYENRTVIKMLECMVKISQGVPTLFDTLALSILTPDFLTRVRLNCFQQPVSAGFPSPAEDYLEGKLDLTHYLIANPAATFYVRVSGNSMTGVGIFSDDLLADPSRHYGNLERRSPPTPAELPKS
jgi:hypothetical protein